MARQAVTPADIAWVPRPFRSRFSVRRKRVVLRTETRGAKSAARGKLFFYRDGSRDPRGGAAENAAYWQSDRGKGQRLGLGFGNRSACEVNPDGEPAQGMSKKVFL